MSSGVERLRFTACPVNYVDGQLFVVAFARRPLAHRLLLLALIRLSTGERGGTPLRIAVCLVTWREDGPDNSDYQ